MDIENPITSHRYRERAQQINCLRDNSTNTFGFLELQRYHDALEYYFFDDRKDIEEMKDVAEILRKMRDRPSFNEAIVLFREVIVKDKN